MAMKETAGLAQGRPVDLGACDHAHADRRAADAQPRVFDADVTYN